MAEQSASAQNTFAAEAENVIINCPEQIDLPVMVDYVGKALGVRFLYGEELSGQRVELRPSPVTVPKEHLLKLLASLLRVRDLTIVEEADGFYRIVRTESAARSASRVLDRDATPDADSLRVVTQVLSVPLGKVAGLTEKLSRYLSSPKSGLFTIPEQNAIIVTDYESRIAMLRQLIALLDGKPAGLEIETLTVDGADVTVLAAQVTAILAEAKRVRQSPLIPPSVRGDILPGQLVIIGLENQLQEAKRMIAQFTPEHVDIATRSYRPRYLGLARAKGLIDHVVLAPGSGLHPPASIHVDEAGGRLFVTAEPATLGAIATLFEAEDVPLPESRRPLRIYRPSHRKVSEMVETLSQLLGEAGRSLPLSEAAPDSREPSRRDRASGAGRTTPNSPTARARAESGAASRQASTRIEGPDYVLTTDEPTNSILAIGTPEFHAQLEVLLDDLDQRRPQVLIEMTLVAITMNDRQDLGVELEGLDLGDAWDYLLFTNFGLSSLDVTTGQRVLEPGVGGNGVIIGPNKVPLIIQALATRGLAKVLSTPKLLVSDNAQGTLRNVDEAPFTSVNASDTVATTSFAGFESAGTTLTVTPHILEGDYLTLEYELSFSNFTGGSSTAAIPPPRTTNSFASTVEIPDGHTMVTGGLIVDNTSDAISEVPLLGRMPVLGRLFQSSSVNSTKTKIFAFIRPVILREDSFEELKYISLKAVENAELLSDDSPMGAPLWMR